MKRILLAASGALVALAAVTATAAGPAAPAATAAASPAVAGKAGPAKWNPTWAGYMAPAPAGRKVMFVGAFWTIPKPDTTRVWGTAPYQVVEWVGMDGWGTGSHPTYGPVQDGVWSAVPAKGGTPVSYLFWEMAGPSDPGPHWYTTDGGPAKPDRSNWVQVHPGDEIGASVQWGDPPVYDPAGKEFYFDVTVYRGGDTLRPEYHDATARPPASWPAGQLRNRAEVITEIPSADGGNGPVGAMDPGVIRYQGAEYLLYYKAGAKLNGVQPVAQQPVVMFWRYGLSLVWIWPSAPYQDRGWTFRDGFATRLHHVGP
jgi:hypothetical protein